MSDKYISAEALTLSLRDDYELNAASFARVKRHIEAAPDMVKRGVWIRKYIKNSKYSYAFCSECETVGSVRWKVCPICEAKMEEGAEDGNT